MSLKKKISLNKNIEYQMNYHLRSENAKLIEQIKELQDQRRKENTATKSAYLLKSETWYSQKLAEELQKTQTKQKFIEKELKEIQKNCN
ncbi:MAG: hypothetical protein CM15mP98_08880 [Paracoccaceae bacterium]|nr:MAG: hypothetical protein CM15mP98_08880 [Paracoccaceae bacterium]